MSKENPPGHMQIQSKMAITELQRGITDTNLINPGTTTEEEPKGPETMTVGLMFQLETAGATIKADKTTGSSQPQTDILVFTII